MGARRGNGTKRRRSSLRRAGTLLGDGHSRWSPNDCEAGQAAGIIAYPPVPAGTGTDWQMGCYVVTQPPSRCTRTMAIGAQISASRPPSQSR